MGSEPVTAAGSSDAFACDDEPESGANLVGLAESWEGAADVRQRLLSTHSLLAWPSPKLTGVISFDTMSMNYKVLSLLIDVWCSQHATPKSVNIDQVREEDKGVKSTNQALSNNNCTSKYQ